MKTLRASDFEFYDSNKRKREHVLINLNIKIQTHGVYEILLLFFF